MRPRLKLAGLVAAAVLAVVLPGCGDDAPDAPGSAQNPLVAQPPDSEAAGGSAGASRSNEAGGVSEEPAEPGFQELVEQQNSKPRSRFSPCSLVSQPRAREILGAPVKPPVEAPQGPTCIYRTVDGEHFVTLAVQAADFGKQRRQMDDAQELDVSSRSAYCGTLGQPMLNVRLSGTRVLTVGAPCEVAKDFAAVAMRRLPS